MRTCATPPAAPEERSFKVRVKPCASISSTASAITFAFSLEGFQKRKNYAMLQDPGPVTMSSLNTHLGTWKFLADVIREVGGAKPLFCGRVLVLYCTKLHVHAYTSCKYTCRYVAGILDAKHAYCRHVLSDWNVPGTQSHNCTHS